MHTVAIFAPPQQLAPYPKKSSLHKVKLSTSAFKPTHLAIALMAVWSTVAVAEVNDPIKESTTFTEDTVYETKAAAVAAEPGVGNTFTLTIAEGKTLTLRSLKPNDRKSNVIDTEIAFGNHVFTGGTLIVEQADLFTKNPPTNEPYGHYRSLIKAGPSKWVDGTVNLTFENKVIKLHGPGAWSAIDARNNTNVVFKNELTIDMDRSQSLSKPGDSRFYGLFSDKGARVQFNGPTKVTLVRGKNDQHATALSWNNGAYGGAEGKLTIIMDGGAATNKGELVGISAKGGTLPTGMPTDKDHELHLKEVEININAPKKLSTATGIEVDRQLTVEGPVTVTIAEIGDADAKGIQIGGASQFALTGLLTVTAEKGG